MVHFFLSQLYARPEQLGIDPTMTLVSAAPGKHPVYDITVHVRLPGPLNADADDLGSDLHTPVTWRTTELINQDNAADLRGRATRVWAVVKVVDGVEIPTQTGVLKDSWIDSDRVREGAVLDEIKGSELSDEDRSLFEDLFLTVLAHGDVLINGVSDNTRRMTGNVATPDDIRFSISVPQTEPPADKAQQQDTMSVATGSQDPAASSASAVSKPGTRPPIVYSEKTRYRVVFLQRCVSLGDLTSMRAAFKHLFTVVFGNSTRSSFVLSTKSDSLYSQHSDFFTRPAGCTAMSVPGMSLLTRADAQGWLISSLPRSSRMNTPMISVRYVSSPTLICIC